VNGTLAPPSTAIAREIGTTKRDQWRTFFQMLASHPSFLFRREHRAMLARNFWRLVRQRRASR